MKETNLLRRVQLAITDQIKNARLFRNNTGTGWQGECKRIGNKLLITDPRPLEAGLCKGSHDLIGWTSVVIMPEMVGKTVAVFTTVEVKTQTGRVSPEQIRFWENVQDAGGFSFFARSETEAVAALSSIQTELCK